MTHNAFHHHGLFTVDQNVDIKITTLDIKNIIMMIVFSLIRKVICWISLWDCTPSGTRNLLTSRWPSHQTTQNNLPADGVICVNLAGWCTDTTTQHYTPVCWPEVSYWLSYSVSSACASINQCILADTMGKMVHTSAYYYKLLHSNINSHKLEDYIHKCILAHLSIYEHTLAWTRTH